MNTISTNDIANDIKEILSHTGSVIIPYFGRFTTQHKSAAIDNIQGQLTAPTFDVLFDPNVRINDGVLVDKISRTHNIDIQEAQKQLNDYLNQASELIAQHEQFTINGLGKIYQDSFGKIQFTSFNLNLNPDSFGLPTVSFQPVSRTQTGNSIVQVPATTKTELINENKPIDTTKFSETTTSTTAKNIYITSGVEEEQRIFGLERTAFWRTFITASLVLATLTILGLTYFNNNNNLKTAEKDAAKESRNSDLPATSTVGISSGTGNAVNSSTDNLVPADSGNLYTGNTILKPEKSTLPLPSAIKVPIENKAANVKEVVIEPKKSVKENSAIIIIGGFGNAGNISKLRKWITQHGYEVYEHPKGDLKIMGAVVHYNSKEELNKITATFKERYGYEIEVKRNE